MEEDNKAGLLTAVNALITAPDAHEMFEALDSVARLAARVPVKLADGSAVLNPILGLRLTDPPAYERVITLIERRRSELGYDPLVPPKDVSFNMNTYMRQFMEEKRQRQRLAATIENMRRPARDQLMGNARLDFMRRQSERWKELRDLKLEAARTANGGVMTAELRSKTLQEFWKTVDADLEAKLETAKREALNPTRRAPGDDLSELMEALKLPPR